jgi:spore coat protein H
MTVLHVKKAAVLMGIAISLLTALCNRNNSENGLAADTFTDDTTSTDTALAKARPDGWEFASHDPDADPDYATLFPADAVNRMDVTISDSAWKVLMDDMTSLSGAFGTSSGMGMGGQPQGDTGQGGQVPVGGGQQTGQPPTDSGQAGQPQDGSGFPGFGDGGMQLPQAFYDAAVGKQMGDTCSCTMMGMTLQGSVDTAGGKLYCKPQMSDIGGGGPNIGDGIGGRGGTEFLSREPVYIPATIEMNGKKWTNVGFRLKGNSSLMSAWGQGVYKLPFRIKTDEFEETFPQIMGQRIYGFQNVALNNNYMDNTLVHEKVASELFRSFDVPAPKSTFIRLYIDYGQGKKYFGLYTMAEVPDAPLLNEWFGNKKGNLYKPDGSGASFSVYNASSFVEKNSGDSSNSDIIALFTALHASRSDAAAWRTGLEKVFKVKGFLKWLAVNTVVKNWDAYGSMAHNYYMYNDKGKLAWIAWDLGLSFSEQSMGMGGMGKSAMMGGGQSQDAVASLTHAQVDSTWSLIRFLMDDSVYRAKYLQDVRRFTTENFTPASVQATIQATHSLIAPYVTGTEPEQSGYTYLSSPADFETAHSSLLEFVAQQAATIDSVLGVLNIEEQ